MLHRSHLSLLQHVTVPQSLSLIIFTFLKGLVSYFVAYPLIWICLIYSHNYTEAIHCGKIITDMILCPYKLHKRVQSFLKRFY